MEFRYLPRKGEIKKLKSLEELDPTKKYYIFRREEIHYGSIQISDGKFHLECERCTIHDTITVTPDFLIAEP